MVEPDGRPCACGGRGCLEAEASGTALATITGRPAELAPPEVVERTGTLVGRAVASVANLLDLPLAVVSGSVALGFGAPFFAAAQREWRRVSAGSSSPAARVWCRAAGGRRPVDRGGSRGWLGLELGDIGAAEAMAMAMAMAMMMAETMTRVGLDLNDVTVEVGRTGSPPRWGRDAMVVVGALVPAHPCGGPG